MTHTGICVCVCVYECAPQRLCYRENGMEMMIDRCRGNDVDDEGDEDEEINDDDDGGIKDAEVDENNGYDEDDEEWIAADLVLQILSCLKGSPSSQTLKYFSCSLAVRTSLLWLNELLMTLRCRWRSYLPLSLRLSVFLTAANMAAAESADQPINQRSNIDTQTAGHVTKPVVRLSPRDNKQLKSCDVM